MFRSAAKKVSTPAESGIFATPVEHEVPIDNEEMGPPLLTPHPQEKTVPKSPRKRISARKSNLSFRTPVVSITPISSRKMKALSKESEKEIPIPKSSYSLDISNESDSLNKSGDDTPMRTEVTTVRRRLSTFRTRNNSGASNRSSSSVSTPIAGNKRSSTTSTPAVEKRNAKGETPLLVASRNGYLDKVNVEVDSVLLRALFCPSCTFYYGVHEMHVNNIIV